MMMSGKTRVAGVMGWPVTHSRSPRLHGWWLEEHGIDGAYIPLPVRPEDFATAVRALPMLGFAGANVTVPHKEAALRACDDVSDLAERIGAVNTLVCRDDGTLYGDNTDGFGFLENLRAGCRGWQADAGPAVVLGAGGAARAVVAALQDAGCPEVRLTNRTRARAEELAASLGGAMTVVDWDARAEALDGAGLLVNTTTLGMEGAPPLEMPLDPLPRGALVTDIVYAPLVTDLLTRAEARGNPVVDGLGMLLHQGRPGFEAWFGVFPEVTDDLRRFVLGEPGA
ncbi:Shikimate 5-dehydrogenase I alpha [Caenispirillum salinarum AK4]|uniref:Shikimate dehydrogenase (NADP(+)) n=1 Tax=Caenispirillum salinarum AK4 TaxID=1238182 RepID=K9H520_9PROT|nr:shikimate dehydrogenase [Caenispirillum salinarum]EKV32154.1 Shikimate 5-dehydrogenase I alpha [Caenispirillum salinarum AK4]